MATFEQERHVELVAGAAESFVITNRMISAAIPAELPHLNVFTVLVNNVLNPDADTLLRVATIGDLSLIPIGRPAGIATPTQGQLLYLSNVWAARYGDLQTALDAADAFRQRVNALITEWANFDTNFSAPDPTPAIYTFPATDTSMLTTLIAAYTAAKQDRYQKQQAKTAADSTLTAAQADYTYKSGLLSSAQAIASGASVVSTDISVLISDFAALLAAGNANPGGGGSNTAAFTAALALATAQQASFTNYTADASQLLSLANSAKTARTADASASATALAAATSDQATKAQALASALALEASTLAAVLAVCPNFNPHSIPLVPG